MAINAHCACGATYSVKRELAGKKVKCPACGESFKVSVPQESAPQESAPSIRVTCQCGYATVVKAKFAGKRAKCPSCNELITIPTDSADESSPVPQGVGETKEKAGFDGGSSNEEGSIEHRPLDVKELVTTSFEILKRHVFLIYGAFIILGLLQNWIVNFASYLEGQNLMPVAELIRIAAFLYFAPGFFLLFLNIARGTSPHLKDLFAGYRFMLKLMLLLPVLCILLVLGTLALIVPGVMILVASYPWLLFTVVDKNPPGLRALWITKDITHGRLFECFCVWVAFYAVAAAGLLLCGIGLIVTGPVSFIMLALWYCQLSGQTDQNKSKGLELIE
ncbi:MAG: hypothetical protein O3C40_24925 [Planctomycetota bacterium]|nr:hypothetical protein [Planctomycetota bacterium]